MQNDVDDVENVGNGGIVDNGTKFDVGFARAAISNQIFNELGPHYAKLAST